MATSSVPRRAGSTFRTGSRPDGAAVRPFISVIATGGTLSEVRGTENLTTGPVLTAEHPLAGLSRPPALPDIRPVNLRFTRSDDATIADIVELANTVAAEIKRGAAGVVVTHGTDTLEEAAFGLDLLVSADVPVVVTGAVRPHRDAGADGPANMLAALLVAAEPAAGGLGVAVVLDDTIHAARYAEKCHVSRPGAFASRACGPVGWLVEGRVRIGCFPPRQRHITAAGGQVPPVAVIKLFLGCDDRAVMALASLGWAGLIVEGFGGGHVPQRVAGALGRLAAELPVVITTRVGGGETLHGTYGSIGDAADLRARGLMSGGVLSSAKAHVALSLLLHSGVSGAALGEMFADIACGCTGRASRADDAGQQMLWQPGADRR